MVRSGVLTYTFVKLLSWLVTPARSWGYCLADQLALVVLSVSGWLAFALVIAIITGSKDQSEFQSYEFLGRKRHGLGN